MKKLFNKLAVFFILFLLYLDNLTQDDLSILKPIGRFFIKPAWFVRKIFIYLLSPILLIWFIVVNSAIYKHFKEEYEVFQQIMATPNKELK